LDPLGAPIRFAEILCKIVLGLLHGPTWALIEPYKGAPSGPIDAPKGTSKELIRPY
jgi:hypothetical protein